MTNNTLVVTHSAGCFSCCTVRLEQIIRYINENGVFPHVDSSAQFKDYKVEDTDDVTSWIFRKQTLDFKSGQTPNRAIRITLSSDENQFSDYSQLCFEDLKPILETYFSLSDEVLELSKNLQNIYNIDVSNTCAIRFRGTDKQLETNQPSYEEVIEHAKVIHKTNPSIQFLVQTDEKAFCDYCYKNLPNVVHIKENFQIDSMIYSALQTVVPKHDKRTHITNFIATMFLISKCRYVIHTSGNGELWMALWRGTCSGLIQYLNPKDYIYGVKNGSYDPSKTSFWIWHPCTR